MRFATGCALLLAFAAFPRAAFALPGSEVQERAQVVLHLLDYVGVDYAGAVSEGKVVDESEYREMREFSARALESMSRLGDHPNRDALVEQARGLARQVENLDAADRVARSARRLRTAVIEAYGVQTAPGQPVDLDLGRRVYAENCSVCHGAEGRGDGRAAAGQDPAPSDFHDAARMSERSLYGLYTTITLGVEGTSMPSFELLDERERWSVAAAIGQFSETGETSGFDLARALLGESVAAYREGRHDDAQDRAIRAYLEGFEPVETMLAIVDTELVRTIEADMMGLRRALRTGEPVQEVERRARRIDQQLERGRMALNGKPLTWVATFSSSFLIMLREGLEAILVLAAMMAFVKKAGRRDALPYVHAGWIAALGLGLVTWVAASYVIEISGADREATEGVTALIAAAMLLYVGYWLHNKAHARAWTKFIRDQVGSALAKRTLWAMAVVAFLAVYREMFEVVLFYQTLWVRTAGPTVTAFVGGLAASVVALLALGWVIIRYSARLPIGPFFSVTSILLALVAVVFAGQGVAALQEAGFVSITPVTWLAAPWLGVFPTTQTLAAQIVTAAVVVASYYLAGREARAQE